MKILNFLEINPIVDWTKEGAAAADWVVEDLPDIASDVWDATTDFFEDTGGVIGDFFEDTGEAAGNFFEDAADAIGGFFSGLFS